MFKRDWIDAADRQLIDRLLACLQKKEVSLPGTLLAVRKKVVPFYDDFDLFELTFARTKDKARLFVIYNDIQQDIRPLDFKSLVIHELNRDAPLNLDAGATEATGDRVKSYLRFFCHFVSGDEGPFYLAEDGDDFDWLDHRDEEAIQRFSKLEMRGRDHDERWRLRGPVVYGKSLFAAGFAVAPDGMVEMLDDKPIVQDLTIRPLQFEDSGRLTLVIEPDITTSHDSITPPERKENPWQTVTSLPKTLNDAFSRRRRPTDPERKKSDPCECRKLPFYPDHLLYRIHAKEEDDQPLTCFVLFRDGEEPVFFDYSSPTIHGFNARELRLFTDNDSDTLERAEAYLRFFCEFIAGDGGPFFIIDSIDDIRWHGAAPPDLAKKINPLAYRGRIAPRIASDSESPASDREGFEFEATMLYANALFRARLIVHSDGLVEMTDDTPIEADLVVKRPEIESDIDVGLRHDGEAPYVAWLYWLDPMTSSDFLDRLKRGIKVSRVLVDDGVRLGGEKRWHNLSSQFPQPQQRASTGESMPEPSPASDERKPVASHERTGGETGQSLADSYQERIYVIRSTIHGGLSLKDAQFKMAVRFDRCRITDYKLTSAKTKHQSSGNASFQSVYDEAIEGLEFDAVKFSGSVSFERCRVEGRLVARGASIEGQLLLRDVAVLGSNSEKAKAKKGQHVPVLDLSELHARSVDASRLRLKGSFSIDRASIDGDFNCQDAHLGPDPAATGFSAIQMTTNGNFELDNARFFQSINLRGSRIGRDLSIAGLWLKSWNASSAAATFEAHHVHVGGNIRAGLPWQNMPAPNSPDWIVTASRRRTRIEGALNLYLAQIDGILDMSGIHLGGELNLSFLRARSVFCRSDEDGPLPAELMGHVSMGGASIDGHVEFSGAFIAGAVWGVSSSIKALYFIPGKRVVSGDGKPTEHPAPVQLQFVPTVIGSCVLLSNTTISGPLRLYGIQVLGSALTPELIASGPFNLVRNTGSFVLENCKVDGDVVACGFLAADRSIAGVMLPDKTPSVFAGDFNVEGCNVDGSIDLREARITGEIRLKRATVRDDVRMRWQCGSRSGLPDASSPAMHHIVTRCAQLNMEGLECNGDVDLTGLEIQTPDSSSTPNDAQPNLAEEKSGHLLARRATIRGRLLLVEELDDTDTRLEYRYAKIPGRLDLTAVTIDHLRLSGHSFNDPASEPNPTKPICITRTHDIRLERAAIERFQVIDPLPCRLDMRSMNVGWWDIGDDEKRRDVFRHLLREDEYKERGTFHSIEQSLLREGHTDDAEAVRRWMFACERGGSTMWGEGMMRWRLRSLADRYLRHKPQPVAGSAQEWLTPPRRRALQRVRLLSWPWNYFWGWFGYSKARLLTLAMAGSLLLMTILFVDARNIAPSLSAIEAFAGKLEGLDINNPCPDGVPSPDRWGGWDAFWLSVRAHMPMLPINGREDWRASPQQFATPFGQTPDWTFTAEDYAALVSFFAWLWWALLLLSLTGMIRRAGLRG